MKEKKNPDYLNSINSKNFYLVFILLNIFDCKCFGKQKCSVFLFCSLGSSQTFVVCIWWQCLTVRKLLTKAPVCIVLWNLPVSGPLSCTWRAGIFALSTALTQQISFYAWNIAHVKYLFSLPATLAPRKGEFNVFMCFILIKSALRRKYFFFLFRLRENQCLDFKALLTNQVTLLGPDVLIFLPPCRINLLSVLFGTLAANLFHWHFPH